MLTSKNPDRIIVVFDATAAWEQNTLNNLFYTGPDLLSSLVWILLRFQRNKTALVAVAEAMFHQVKLTKETLIL